MSYMEILAALREFTSPERVDFLPPAPEPAPLSAYAPIGKYVLDLRNGAKPETAAQDLFTALCKDVLGFQPTRQVGVAEGYVNFMLPEYLTPFDYEITKKGQLNQVALPQEATHSLASLLNSLVLNFYIRSKISANVNLFHLYELPIPKLAAAQRIKLTESAAKLMKNPRDVEERTALEVYIARELYGLSLDDWKHLTSTFTSGNGATKAELDEIIRQSLALWPQRGPA